MTGSEKIIDCIRADGEAAVAAIRADADAQCRKIADNGKEKAQAEAESILESARQQCARMKKSAQSAAELYIKNALLMQRRKEIDNTLSTAVEKLCALPDGEYFDALVSVASAYGSVSGEIFLNERDLKRMPQDFASQLKAAGVDVSVSSTPVDIVGGFILKCGDIEYCADFGAIIEEKREELEDMINRELFVK